MYHGEVNVAQEELNSFLAVAEDLKVKGLTQNPSASGHLTKDTNKARKYQETIKESKQKPSIEQQPTSINQPSQFVKKTFPSFHINEVDDDIQQNIPVKTEPRELQTAAVQPETNYVGSTVLAQPVAMYQEEQGYEEYGEEQQYMEEGNNSMGNTLQGIVVAASKWFLP